MLSTEELRTILAIKRKDLEIEKVHVGLTSHGGQSNGCDQNSKREQPIAVYDVGDSNGSHSDTQNDHLPIEFLKLMRKNSGLPPIMLKTGEYSPNNPLLRSDSEPYVNDLFLGLGEYEERKKRMRKIKQQEYKRFLDMQNEQKRMLVQQLQKRKESMDNRNNVKQNDEAEKGKEKEKEKDKQEERRTYSKSPISIGVQTDEFDIAKPFVKEAEKELSPRRVLSTMNGLNDGVQDLVGIQNKRETQTQTHMARMQDARHKTTVKDFAKENRESESKSVAILPRTERISRRGADFRPAYVPTLFDEDVIRQRNMKAEQEAVEKRMSYQKELRDQIVEQQRFREERKAREKLYEEAERRRLEEQLRVIKLAQNTEAQKHQDIAASMAANSRSYEAKRKQLEDIIDVEKKNVTRSRSQPLSVQPLTAAQTKLHASKSEKLLPPPSNLPLYYAYSPTILSSESLGNLMQRDKNDRYTSNLTKSTTFLPRSVEGIDFGTTTLKEKLINSAPNSKELCDSLMNRPNIYGDDILNTNKAFEPTFFSKDVTDLITLSSAQLQNGAPVVRHSPRESYEGRAQSDDMKKVEGKWRVPVVQKNITKKLPNVAGAKTTNILTQLGSIRRQLQLEQMKLDKLLTNNNAD